MISVETVLVVIAMIVIHEGFSIMGRNSGQKLSLGTYFSSQRNIVSLVLSLVSSIVLLYMGEGVMDLMSMGDPKVYAVFVGYSGQSVFKNLMKGYENRIQKRSE